MQHTDTRDTNLLTTARRLARLKRAELITRECLAKALHDLRVAARAEGCPATCRSVYRLYTVGSL